MIRFLFCFPISEKYFVIEKAHIIEKFFLKRLMYSENVSEERFTFFVKKQLTLNSFIEKNSEKLISKINKKFRNEIRQFSKIKNENKNVKIIIENHISKKLKFFLLKNYRGQKPNIKKLNLLSKKNLLYVVSLKYKEEYQTSLIWLSNKNKARLLYNVLEHNSLKLNKFTSANKYIMFKSILSMSIKGLKKIDLGGISSKNNPIDRFKKGYAELETYSYNYFYL